MRFLIPLAALILSLGSAAAGTQTDKLTLTPQASPSCASGKSCLYSKTGDSLLYTADAAGLELKLHAAQQFRSSSNCSGLGSPTAGDVCYDTSLGVFRFFGGSWTTGISDGSLYVALAGAQTITGVKTFSAAPVFSAGASSGGNLAMGANKITGLGTPTASTDAATKGYVDSAAPEILFTRSCTLTAAAADTPVDCLADADVPASKKAYMMGWRVKVNGGSAWSPINVCTIEDTTGTDLITIGATTLGANAFVIDASANVTQETAYALNQGSATAKGLRVVCVSTDAGSDLVFTLFGAIK